MLARSARFYAAVSFAVLSFTVLMYFSVRHRIARTEEPQAQRLVSHENRLGTDFEADYIDIVSSKEESLEKFLGELENGTRERCPVFTFSKNITKENEEAIRFWTRAWYQHGFQPYVLTEKDALSRPEYGSLLGKIPSMEVQSGYLRWLALSSVQGGLYADIDVIPIFGHEKPFQEYVEKRCAIPETLTISDEFKFDLFLFGQDLVKALVKRLTNESYLKGRDELWLSVHLKDYRIKKNQFSHPVFKASSNAYYQKHRASMKDIVTAGQLKKVLKASNLLNTHKIYFLDSEKEMQKNYFQTLLMEELKSNRSADIKADRNRILPFRFDNQVTKIASLRELPDGIQLDSNTLVIAFVYEPNGHGGKSESKLLETLFPGISRDSKERQLRHLKELLRTKKVLLVPMSMEPSKIALFLEFQLGILLPKQLESTAQTPAPSHDTTSVEKELYDIIVSVFKDSISQLIEFDYE